MGSNSLQKGNFGEGSVSLHIIKMGVPIFLAGLVNVFYNIVDRIYLGHMSEAGTAALTGVGIATPVISFIAAFAAICSTGGAPLFSIARGSGDLKKAKEIQETTFTFGITVSLILIAVLYPILPWALDILGGEPDTLPYAISYTRIYLFGSPFVILSLGMNNFINAQGYSKIGMLTVMLGAVMNLILDPIFIFVFKMGIAGAAIATVISQGVSAAWAVHFLTRKAPIRVEKLGISKVHLISVIKLGVTGFCFKITNSITQAVINVVLESAGGALSSVYIGSMTIVSSLREVSFQPVSGMADGFKPVAGYNYGARKYDRVSSAIRSLSVIGLTMNAFMWLGINIFTRPIICLFTDDPLLIETTIPCVRAFFALYILMACQQCGQSVFQALNMPKYALFFSIFRKVIVVLPLTIILPKVGLGVIGVFLAEPASELIGATLCYVVMCLRVWRHLGDWDNYQNSKQK